MEFLKRLIQKQQLSFFFGLAAVIFPIIAGIAYATGGVNKFNGNISALVVTFYILCAAISLIGVFLPFREIKAISFFFALMSLILYFGTQANYVAAIAVAIDPDAVPSPNLILVVVMSVIAILATLASTIFFSSKKANMEVVVEKKGE